MPNEINDSLINKPLQADQPLVSVIIPVYNVSAYLSQCLDSVLAQTYHNLEIIVIDDGSTDGSGSICDSFALKDKRVHVFHTKNNGLATARNIGLQHVHGLYLLFADSDDWIEKHTIATLLAVAQTEKADIVVGKKITEYIGKSIPEPKAQENIQVFKGNNILPAYVNGTFSDIVWNKLYKTTVFNEIYFPDGHNYEDIATTWKIMKTLSDSAGSIAILSSELFHFRMRKSSISHTRSLENIIDSWNACLEKYMGLTDYQEQTIASCVIVARSLWINYISFSKEDKSKATEVFKEMQTFIHDHNKTIIRGNYPSLIKLTCFCFQTNSSLIMWLSYLAQKARIHLKNQKNRMYN